MIALLLPLIACCAVAAPRGGHIYSGIGVFGPSYNAPIVPVGAVKLTEPKGASSYTLTNVDTPTGAIKQQTAVEKDALGGHTIRHAAQSTNVDPHSGQTDVTHDEHEFHINPFIGQAAVHTNNAAGSLNPAFGQAAFSQKSHEAKIAPGHSSVADIADTAAVSHASSAASRDVNAARIDALPEGVAKNAHASHKSYVNTPGVAGHSQAFETNRRSFDGHGYGNLHYDSQAAKKAYDAHGHSAASEAGYKLDQVYDARVNLGASNELEYSRQAAHDPYGNYGAVTQTRQASQGGQLVPVVHEEPAVLLSQPVAIKEVVPAPVVYSHPAPIAYKEKTSVVYKEPAVLYKQPAVAYKAPAVYKEPVAYQEPVVYDSHAYAPIGAYPHGGYYHHGY